jgi:hypothetical protein
VPKYLDVGVVRIQRYLARETTLKGQRGASALVQFATNAETICESVTGVSPNPDAVEADGVVHLIVNDELQESNAAHDVLRYLGDQLPSAELEASFASAPTYTEARSELLRMGAEQPIRRLPALAEFPIARRCDFCSSAPAQPRDNSGKSICPDCNLRLA